MAAIKIR